MREFIVRDVPYVSQTTYETCWLAFYRMMLGWNNKSPEMAERLPNHKAMRRDGILDWQLPGCRRALGLLSSSYSGFQDADDIEWKLRTYGPIWISGYYADEHMHVVVLHGVRGVGSSAQVLSSFDSPKVAGLEASFRPIPTRQASPKLSDGKRYRHCHAVARRRLLTLMAWVVVGGRSLYHPRVT